MTTKKTADQWFAEYGESHQNHTNELIHWICVPLIFLSVLGLVFSIPLPAAIAGPAPWFNWSQPAMALAMLCYLRLSPSLSAGMLLFMSLCYMFLACQESFCPFPIWKSSLIVFVLAWIGQFIGHRIEGKKPSFFKDLLFLLIGPAWLMSKVYRKLGQAY
jgi:uncharacterized membrane protein YGL010W